jgi:hypothetical protein
MVPTINIHVASLYHIKYPTFGVSNPYGPLATSQGDFSCVVKIPGDISMNPQNRWTNTQVDDTMLIMSNLCMRHMCIYM